MHVSKIFLCIQPSSVARKIEHAQETRPRLEKHRVDEELLLRCWIIVRCASFLAYLFYYCL